MTKLLFNSKHHTHHIYTHEDPCKETARKEEKLTLNMPQSTLNLC